MSTNACKLQAAPPRHIPCTDTRQPGRGIFQTSRRRLLPQYTYNSDSSEVAAQLRAIAWIPREPTPPSPSRAGCHLRSCDRLPRWRFFAYAVPLERRILSSAARGAIKYILARKASTAVRVKRRGSAWVQSRGISSVMGSNWTIEFDLRSMIDN